MSENEQDLGPPSIAEIQQSMVLTAEAKAIRRQYLTQKKTTHGLAAERLMEDCCNAWWRTRTPAQREWFKTFMQQMREVQKNDMALRETVLHTGDQPEDHY